jgi:hypothetical protein
MKKQFFLLSITFILLSGVVINAQKEANIKLFMPSFSPSSSTAVEQVKSGNNFNLPRTPTFNGYRAGNKNQTVSKINDPEKYPIMTPFLLVAEPSGTSNEVVWNITSNNNNVHIISAPVGSIFESSSHVRTPVLKQSQSVNVENPVIIKEGCPELNPNWMRNAQNSFTHKSLYSGDMKEYCVDKKLSVSSGSSYIIVMATAEEYSHISAVSYTNGDVDQISSVVGHVQFVPTPYVSGGCSYDLVVSGGPTESPIECGKNVEFVVHIENRNQDIDLSQVVLKLAPQQISWFQEVFKSLGSGILKKGETKDFTFNVDVDWDKINVSVGVLKARVTILYPTSPDLGKWSDLDVSFTCDPVQKELAGIETKLAGRSLYIKNTAPNEPGRILRINSISGVPKNQHNIRPQDWEKYDEPSTDSIVISYTLFFNNKELGNYSLTIRK